MGKVKIVIVCLTVLLLAAIILRGIATAAQVAWVNESKGRVHINGGVDDGYVAGAIVCFFISAGENLACGIVQSASDHEAVVKIEKRWAKKILKGAEAILYVEEEDEGEVKEDKR